MYTALRQSSICKFHGQHTHTVVSTEPPFTTGTSKSNNWPHHFFAMLAVDLVVIIVLVMCMDLRHAEQQHEWEQNVTESREKKAIKRPTF